MGKYEAFIKKTCYLNPFLCVLRWTLGILFLSIGFAGFLLPVIPGFIFILLGLPLVGAGWIIKWLLKLWRHLCYLCN
ncbi:hypothetical protein KAU11_01530 [Candidatus Babeliales bacterium]|nr:hypothetical protein [Candidatus Babeliales bacterium]